MRVTDQYFWNLVFSVVFLVFLFMGVVILDGEAYKPIPELTLVDFVLITLASFRVTRLIVYDHITAFFREQFYNVAGEGRGKLVLEKPIGGPRRTLADLLSCPWCFGVWATATVAFFYLLTPLALFPVLLLALSGVATFFQLLANMIGWKAEKLKREVERM